MFFSDDLLTSKKGSFGIIWLMATLGPRGKKISRKQLTGVDLAKTCDLIAEPPEPMALRLSGCLLVGVARVYNQNIEIFHSDVTTFHSTLRRSIVTDFAPTESGNGTAVTGLALDLPGGGKSRVDAITFGGIDFELGLDYEFRHIDWNNPLGTKRKRRASSLLSSQQTQDSQQGADEEEGEEEEDEEEEEEEGSEMGRAFKRKKDTASPAAVGSITKTRMSFHHPSDRTSPNLYANYDVLPGQEVDLGLDLDDAGTGGADDSFSGPSGRGMELADIGGMDAGAFDGGFNMLDMNELLGQSRQGSIVPSARHQGAVASPAGSATKSKDDQQHSRGGSLEYVEGELQVPKKRVKKPKCAAFEESIELYQEADRDARHRYRFDMEEKRRELQIREQERTTGIKVAEMLANGGGGFAFFNDDMSNFLADIIKVLKFKWELDVAANRQGRTVADANEQERNENEMQPAAEYGGFDVFGPTVFDDNQMIQGNDTYQEAYQDYSTAVHGSSRRPESVNGDIEHGRRGSQQSQQYLPWENRPSSDRAFTPGFDGDSSFSPPSLRLSIMTPQEARIRLNSRGGTGSGRGSTTISRHGRFRSASLVSDRADDDPLLLTTAGVGDLESVPPDEPLEIGSLGMSQQERLRALPEAFRPEILATLERQCRDFFTYVERKMLNMNAEQLEFEDLVPSASSSKRVAAMAFYDCLTLATKRIITVAQPEPWETITVQFTVQTE